MKLGRLAAAALAVSVGFGPIAEAGNGSNYIHMLNGIDYFFGIAPYSGAPGLQGIWRCFPSDMLHSPTRVTDPGSPEAGNYASKICAVHQSTNASPFIAVTFPNITLSTSDGKCHFLASGGTALNFGLATGTGNGFAVIGPLTGQGTAATVSGAWAIANVGFTNPFSAPNIIIQTILNLVGLFGSPSAVPVPDGEALTLWHADMNTQAAGNNNYWTGSFDERNLCSGYSFLLSGGSLASVVGIGFNPAWEWSTGVGTVDATMTNVVAVGASGGGPSGLNAHASSTAFASPFDQGTGAMTVSVSGAGLFGATTSGSGGDILGYNSYDESNAFGGAGRLVFANLWRLTLDGSPNCTNSPVANPNELTTPTGGPGGPALSPLGTNPRSVAQLDTLALTLAANPLWTGATIHTTTAGGSNIPWFPAAAGISGSTGNGSGFMIPVPPLPTLVGITLFSSSVGLNASSTAIAALANNGHSHSNGSALTFFP
jgi:hypothetical protein